MNQFVAIFKTGKLDGGGERYEEAIRIDDIKIIRIEEVDLEHSVESHLEVSKIITKNGEVYISEEDIETLIDRINGKK